MANPKSIVAYPTNPVLIVDDEEAIVSGYRMALTRGGITRLLCHTDSREALAVIRTTPLDLVLLDLNMPHVTGEELLAAVTEQQPGVPILIVTGKDTIESAVDCMRSGAHDYLVKPVPADRVVTAVRNALQFQDVVRENERLRENFLSEELKNPEFFSEIVTGNPLMKSIFMYVEAIAPTSNPVLLTGETGVGKELIARAIHKASRRVGRFVAVNIAGLDDTMFSDALFGHKKGAFTGAESARPGLIAQASGGTLFLDEIGDLAITSQVKLLRLLQEQEYTPLGEDRPIRTDARMIVATNADLAKLQESAHFRPDLYYRLSTHKIRIPPLRKRHDDIKRLVDHFLVAASRTLGRRKPAQPRELEALLATYAFPGNIRELEAMVTDAVSRNSSNVLSLISFKEHIASLGKHDGPDAPEGTADTDADDAPGLFGAVLPSFASVKGLLIAEALRRTHGNRSRAAELLGTTRQALSWHLRNKG